uniref:ATP-dependent DNA helicase n=1 Tax=Heterorhabditis bacteriophora TaxID=37862 RepID=A0A1I7X5X8_HETBA
MLMAQATRKTTTSTKKDPWKGSGHWQWFLFGDFMQIPPLRQGAVRHEEKNSEKIILLIIFVVFNTLFPINLPRGLMKYMRDKAYIRYFQLKNLELNILHVLSDFIDHWRINQNFTPKADFKFKYESRPNDVSLDKVSEKGVAQLINICIKDNKTSNDVLNVHFDSHLSYFTTFLAVYLRLK